MTTAEIKSVFRRHRGSKTRLAEDLGVALPRISDWFGRRRISGMIDREIRKRAAELAAKEHNGE